MPDYKHYLFLPCIDHFIPIWIDCSRRDAGDLICMLAKRLWVYLHFVPCYIKLKTWIHKLRTVRELSFVIAWETVICENTNYSNIIQTICMGLRTASIITEPLWNQPWCMAQRHKNVILFNMFLEELSHTSTRNRTTDVGVFALIARCAYIFCNIYLAEMCTGGVCVRHGWSHCITALDPV